MIIRVVKMTFREGEEENFLEIFRNAGNRIRAFEGCSEVQLLRSPEQGNIFFTLSKWQNDDSLQAYRKSDLFQKTWKKTKALFSERAVAWSLNPVDL